MYQPCRPLSTEQKSLPPFTFAVPFFAKKQACGPEGRALRGKSIGGKKNPFGGSFVLPQNEAGPSGARSRASRDAPTSESAGSWRKNGLPARPKKRGAPYGFCAQRPSLRAGQGLKFNRLYPYLAKSESGQEQKSLFFLFDSTLRSC
jgi:hypothetical protein